MTNIFMQQVKAAILFKWKDIFKYFSYKKKFNKFKKTIMRGSPSFGVLWNFAEFIQYSEIIFGFDNCKESYLYSSRNYTPGQSGFRIQTDDIIITVKLWSDNQKVGIDIENKHGDNVKTNYTFIEGKFTQEPDEYDLLHIDRIIEIINIEMIDLLEWAVEEKLNVDTGFSGR